MKIALSLVFVAALAAGCAAPSAEGTKESPTEAEDIGVATAELKLSQLLNIPKWEPFETEGFSTCANESYAFEGKMLNWTKTRTDRQGGTHVSTILLIKGTGTGLDSGAKYVTFEGGYTAESYFASGAQDIYSVFRGNLYTPDPNVPNERYEALYHLHLEADGTVTTSIDEFNRTCD